MSRAARISLLLPLLAIAACQTERKPLTGFDKPPPGILLDGDNTVLVWPIFNLPLDPLQTFRARLNGQDAVTVTSQEGFYDYASLQLQGWAAAYGRSIGGIPSGTYTVELVDSSGQSWGQSAPVPISAGNGLSNRSILAVQLPTVLFAHFGGQTGSWTIDPTAQDSDAATDEITVTNLVAEDVAVERCLIAAAGGSSCTPVGTVAPGADLFTVETVAPASTGDHQALIIHLASDASQSYQRDLVLANPTYGNGCQIERILVHGRVPIPPDAPSGVTEFALSSCYGYGSGGTSP